MMQINVISVGTLKEAYLRDAVTEYKKRLSQYAKIEETVLKEETIFNEDDQTEINKALFCEGERILAAIPKDSAMIALCVEGKEYDSPALAERIRTIQNEKGRMTLIIGSSHGLHDSVKARADLKLSVSKMTFPHQLMKVILYEAIYRSFTIISGKRYHK